MYAYLYRHEKNDCFITVSGFMCRTNSSQGGRRERWRYGGGSSGRNIQQTLRLAEVDCPENKQPFGKNAKKFTSSQVFNKRITYVQTDKDRYGRVIAKIYYDNGKYLSAELIKAGLGWWYYSYSKDRSLGVLQEQAKKQKLGLWQDVHAMAPWDFRKAQREKYKENRAKRLSGELAYHS